MSRPVVMGVVNVTPDSFSDGGEWFEPEAAIAHGHELRRRRGRPASTSGASPPGPGAERPGVGRGAAPRSARRHRPGRGGRARLDRHHAGRGRRSRRWPPAPPSSTTSAAGWPTPTWRRSWPPPGCRSSPCTGAATAPTCSPGGLRRRRRRRVRASCVQRVEVLRDSGIRRHQPHLDPGFGFAKTADAQLGAAGRTSTQSSALGHPVLVGASRKAFLGRVGRAAGADRPDRTTERTPPRRRRAVCRARRRVGACGSTTYAPPSTRSTSPMPSRGRR